MQLSRSLIALASALAITPTLQAQSNATAGTYFQRIAYLEAVRNAPADRKKDSKSVAEIIAASEDGMLLAYTDGEQNGIGLIDLRNPAKPVPAGFIAVQGEPTSLVISQGKIIAAVDATTDNTQPQGHLAVIDIRSRKVVDRCNLQGQPDSVALDKKAQQLVVVLENQRDEKLNKGAIPQYPAGNLSVLPMRNGMPDCTGLHPISMIGLAEVAGDDPEPEFVKVNGQGIAVVSLQENNHLALVDVAKRTVIRHFSAGKVNLKDVDTKRDGSINPKDSLQGVAREPDAVAWLDDTRFVTANEGDYLGGSRGFSIWNVNGTVEYDSGNFLDHEAIRLGHYPEKRSAAKGNEPEGAEVGVYGKDRLIFIGSERSSLVSVWQDMGPGKAPKYLQSLSAGAGPEGLLAIPQRNLLVVASETDGAARAGVMVYARSAAEPAYPTLLASDSAAGAPIAWGAISGLSADRKRASTLWAVTDSAYTHPRILKIDTGLQPAIITDALVLTVDGKPAPGLDAEGIAQRADGSFWIASEGNPDLKEGALRNALLHVSAKGEVRERIELPHELQSQATRFGLEGVTVTGSGADETVWLAVQREWKDDPKGLVKILRYQVASKTWGVLHYPLDKTAVPGAWTGLSEITAVGNDSFVVIERDNQFGDQAFKTLQSFSVRGLTPAPVGSANVPVVSKRLVRNLVPDLQAPKGYVQDKVESFAIDAAGNAFAITDNDGVDGTNGETHFLRLGKLGEVK